MTASGEVNEVMEVDGELRARCTVRLLRSDDLIVSGTAEVATQLSPFRSFRGLSQHCVLR